MGDSLAVDAILRDMIKSVLVGERTAQEALEDAAARVTVIIQKIIE
jgi:ABC-type glycerol-3-phosphate transport system substrate-binding protein